MQHYSLKHISDRVLLRNLAGLVIRSRRNTAALLAHIAEVDARKLYAPAGYPSMFAYCVEELRLSEDGAYKRIQAARAAREFPHLLGAVADGRLHLTAVCLLVPHLTSENVDELVEAATHRRKHEIEEILARRLTLTRPVSLLQVSQLAPAQVVNVSTSFSDSELPLQPMDESVLEDAAAQLQPVESFVHLAVRASTRAKIQYAQSLLSHALPSADLSQVLERALDLLIAQVEKRKFGTGMRTARRSSQPPVDSRYIPADVRHAVWQRDGGQCTFVSAAGKRCTARRLLEFDHVEPMARGGKSTVEGLRLRCRAHNQLEAERVFGSEFMKRKREESQLHQDVFSGLRNLGVRANEARRAADYTDSLAGQPIEERLRAALKFLSPGRSTG